MVWVVLNCATMKAQGKRETAVYCKQGARVIAIKLVYAGVRFCDLGAKYLFRRNPGLTFLKIITMAQQAPAGAGAAGAAAKVPAVFGHGVGAALPGA